MMGEDLHREGLSCRRWSLLPAINWSLEPFIASLQLANSYGALKHRGTLQINKVYVLAGLFDPLKSTGNAESRSSSRSKNHLQGAGDRGGELFWARDTNWGIPLAVPSAKSTGLLVEVRIIPSILCPF